MTFVTKKINLSVKFDSFQDKIIHLFFFKNESLRSESVNNNIMIMVRTCDNSPTIILITHNNIIDNILYFILKVPFNSFKDDGR